jgi:hypothetical protein
LPAGLSGWAVPPALGDQQAQAIDPGWRVRRTGYKFLTSPQARTVLRGERITVISYREIQQAWSRAEKAELSEQRECATKYCVIEWR